MTSFENALLAANVWVRVAIMLVSFALTIGFAATAFMILDDLLRRFVP